MKKTRIINFIIYLALVFLIVCLLTVLVKTLLPASGEITSFSENRVIDIDQLPSLADIQIKLNEIGYAITVGGVVGPETRAAWWKAINKNEANGAEKRDEP